MRKLGEIGNIKLADGAILKLKITIVDIKEGGFSPFGNISFNVKTLGGISTVNVPDKIIKAVVDKPIAPPSSEPPHDGWEIIDIVEQEEPELEETVESSKGKFRVKVVAEAVMAARNMNYKTVENEPIYWISWVWKISWKPVEEDE